MKKKAILFMVFITLLIPTGVIFARNLLNRPLDPPLELEVPFIAKVAEAPSSQSNQQNEWFCGNTGKMNILQIGVASQLEAGHSGADLIRLVVVDFDQMTAEILALPADLYVNTPEDLVDELDYYAPLNLIYLTALETAPGNNEQVRIRKATQTLAHTILDEFGFVPDKYININGDAFIELVDTLGGISITLSEEVDGTPEFYDVYPKGKQELNGQQTLDFVRILYPKGIGLDYFGRFERQNLVILALLDAVPQRENWDAVPDLLKEARKMVITDLSVDQARDLACMVEEVDGDAKLVELTLDKEVFINEDGHMIPVDIDAIKELIDLLQGDSE